MAKKFGLFTILLILLATPLFWKKYKPMKEKEKTERERLSPPKKAEETEILENVVPGIKLKGIISDGEKSLVIINDKIMAVSESIGSAKLIEIREDEVVLNDGGKDLILKLEVKTTIKDYIPKHAGTSPEAVPRFSTPLQRAWDRITAKTVEGKIIEETDKYIIYGPSVIDSDKKCPLVIALSPGADAKSMIEIWKSVSEKHEWIIFASKEFHNRIKNGVIMPRLYSDVERIVLNYPIDKSKVIATGFSGGGMGSYALCFWYPELVSAIVINTGMMHEYYTKQEKWIKQVCPGGKVAVFLASPTDFRYDEMKRDKEFLERLGWETKWIEFKGGHRLAPHSVYEEAAQWIEGQFK